MKKLTLLVPAIFIIIFIACNVGKFKSAGDENGNGNTSQYEGEYIPLTDMTSADSYKGESGGLYGNGSNEIPGEHLKIVQEKLSEIKPINGKIGFISIGMSNTSYEFKMFIRRVRQDRNKSKYLVVGNGAQGGVTADKWADHGSRCWSVLNVKLRKAGLDDDQVQIVWLKTAHKEPKVSMPGANSDAELLHKDIKAMVLNLKDKFPNLKIIYMSSRIYAGYATSPLNPEPFAYESAFGVRSVILDQINGDPELSPSDNPALVWGPYLWADGERENKYGIKWSKSDFDPKDYTHPSRGNGDMKVGNILYDFFTTSDIAKSWYFYK